MTMELIRGKGVVIMNYLQNYQKNRQERMMKEKDNEEFLSEILRTKQNLELAWDNFNFVTEESIKEYYIYLIKAEETKLDHYFQVAKKELRENPIALCEEKGCG